MYQTLYEGDRMSHHIE